MVIYYITGRKVMEHLEKERTNPKIMVDD